MISVDVPRSFPLHIAYIGFIPLQHPQESQPSPVLTANFVMEQLWKTEARFQEGTHKNVDFCWRFWTFVWLPRKPVYRRPPKQSGICRL